MSGDVKEIDYKTAVDFLLPRHYSGRVPSVSVAYGLFSGSELKAVCTFGKPASPNLCIGICGKENAERVYELNRLCRTEDWKEPLSQFVSACLRDLCKKDWIIVSYSDTAMNHHGYIYQACNFLYTGCTKSRTDKYVPNGKHSRHYKNSEQGEYRRFRSGKHRYVYFCTKDKRLKKRWESELRYPIQPYPKGDNNKDYILGHYMKPVLVKRKEKTQERECKEMSIDSREGKYYPVCDYCGLELNGCDTFKEAVQEAEDAGWFYDRREEEDYCEDCKETYGVG